MQCNENMVKYLREQYPQGTRIRLERMDDPYAPVPPGTMGTVEYVDDGCQLGMKWDNGRSLSLIPGQDIFNVIQPELTTLGAMKQITIDELRNMTATEGLILQGCGGDLREWSDGINEMLTDEQILQNGDTFKDVRAFERNGLTNLFFNMENVDLNVGKLAMWRLATHDTFGGTWLSDYRTNQLGMEHEQPSAVCEENEIGGMKFE